MRSEFAPRLRSIGATRWWTIVISGGQVRAVQERRELHVQEARRYQAGLADARPRWRRGRRARRLRHRSRAPPAPARGSLSRASGQAYGRCDSMGAHNCADMCQGNAVASQHTAKSRTQRECNGRTACVFLRRMQQAVTFATPLCHCQKLFRMRPQCSDFVGRCHRRGARCDFGLRTRRSR